MAMAALRGEVPLLDKPTTSDSIPPAELDGAVGTPQTPPRRRVTILAWAAVAVTVLGCVGVATGLTSRILAKGVGGDGDDDDYDSSFYWPFETDDDDEGGQAGFEELNHELMRLSPEKAHARFGARQPTKATPPRQDKIDHFVVLYMENHAADQFFGCMDLPGFNSSKGHTLPKDPTDPSKGTFEITCGDAPYVCSGGPSYSTYDGKFGPNASPHTYPYSAQDDKWSANHGATEGGTAVKMYSPQQVPVKAVIAKEFGVFNKLYTAVPSASSPNHLFTQSATSCGMQANALYNDCGGKSVSFPQKTIYDSLREHNVSFGFFMNSTCGLDGKPCHGENPITTDSPSAISTPDVALEGVARYKERFFSQEHFYNWSAQGTLPAFSWVHPPIQACDHPCQDIAKGERLLKDVYEALRAGPKWKKTLLLVAYDDAGGYYDHVVPPSEGVPADESDCNVPGGRKSSCGEPFDFRRLGLRTTGMLISPWVPKGAVFQEPRKGPTNSSQFELTSVPATVKNLFNLSSFLTKRDAWAGSFDELLLDEPRGDDDCPMHLPDAPPPAKPWDPPPGDAKLPVDELRRDLHRFQAPTAFTPEDDDGDDGDDGEATGRREARRAQAVVDAAGRVAPAAPIAQHCSSRHGGVEEACRGPGVPNLKQRRNARLLAGLLSVQEPNVDAMSYDEAERWLHNAWREWMARK